MSGTLHNWMKLAAAVVKSGEERNDDLFLHSSWYRFLKDTIQEYAHHYAISHSKIHDEVLYVR